MNTVGPLHNRQETYPYFQLPFCSGPYNIQHHHETLGEALQGMDLVNSGIPIEFKSMHTFEKRESEKKMTRKLIAYFRKCIQQNVL